MKKFLPYILILVIIANLFAPFSVVFNQKNGVKIESTEAKAGGENGMYLDIQQYSNTSDTISITIHFEHYPLNTLFSSETKFEMTLRDSSGNVADYQDGDTLKLWDNKGTSTLAPSKDYTTFHMNYTFKNLKEASTYTLEAKSTYDKSYAFDPDEHVEIYAKTDKGEYPIPLQTFDPNNVGSGLSKNFASGSASGGDTLPACGILIADGTILGCVVQIFYYVLFVPTSFIFGLAGQFFDWAFAYSIADSSYRSTFVTEGWGIVRDISNLFFIFVLIYAAFGMILSIHSIKAKEIIVNTILIGLLINFSLFAGQVLIDLSNILTRVFYNSEVITVSLANDASATTASGININQNSALGEIAMSAALVNKVNPQRIILEMGSVQPKDPANKSNESNISMGTWILVILLASAVNIVGLYVFFSVALLFIARVIGLWFALIFAPFAFFSYTVPQMQNVDRIGWKKWWPELLGLCFMAPIFMFLMYLILMFLNTVFTGLNGQIAGTNFLLSVIVPFVFIIMLLIMAKKIAVKYSSQMGEIITKAGAMAGGAALGVGLGAVAVAGRGTLGRIGSAVASSDRLKASEAKGGVGGFFAKNLLKGGKALGTGSMDVRGIKVGGKTLANTGLTGLESLSKKNEGGFIKRREDKVKARQERMRELEVGEDSELKQNVYKKQNALDAAKSNIDTQNKIDEFTKAISDAEKDISSTERDIAAAERKLKDAIDSKKPKSVQDSLRNDRDKEIAKRDKIIKDQLDFSKDGLKDAEKDIKEAEKELKKAENLVIASNRERRENYAKNIQGVWSNSVNMVLSGGQHAVRGEREAANKILAGIKDEKK